MSRDIRVEVEVDRSSTARLQIATFGRRSTFVVRTARQGRGYTIIEQHNCVFVPSQNINSTMNRVSYFYEDIIWRCKIQVREIVTVRRVYGGFQRFSGNMGHEVPLAGMRARGRKCWRGELTTLHTTLVIVDALNA